MRRGGGGLARSRSKKPAMAAVASEVAQEAFKDACTRVFMAAAVWTPKGSVRRTVDLCLAAMRHQLERHERSWARQLKA